MFNFHNLIYKLFILTSSNGNVADDSDDAINGGQLGSAKSDGDYILGILLVIILVSIFILVSVWFFKKTSKPKFNSKNHSFNYTNNFIKSNMYYLNNTYNISNIIGVTPSILENKIYNNSFDFSIEEIRKVAEFLNISIDDLINKDLSKENK